MTAAELLRRGHVPLVGINAALPVLEKTDRPDNNKAAMDISMAVMSACEGLLIIAESPGANRERDFILAKGLPVYYSLDDIPVNSQ